MRLYEWEAKALLTAHNIAVPEGVRARNPQEAAEAAAMLGRPVVIKAQVLTGRRMKAGGIRYAADADQAEHAAAVILDHDLLGLAVDEVLVEERIEAEQEFYLAITYDYAAKTPIILASVEGGIDVEQTAQDVPAKLTRQEVDMDWPFSTHKAREIAEALGLIGRDLLTASSLIRRLYELFYRYDAILVEINPLVRSAGAGFVALDARIELEDEALGRHPDLVAERGILPRPTQARPPTPFEEAAARIDAADHRGVAGRVVEFDGELGLLIGGGGASLTVFDAVLANGGRPANYCEIGGNPSVRKIKDLTQLILSRPGVRKLAVIMNVVSNTRVDLVARGVIKGIAELGLDPREVLAVFRVPGAWEAEGGKILRHYGITFYDRTVSLDEAARVAVEKSRGSNGYPGK